MELFNWWDSLTLTGLGPDCFTEGPTCQYLWTFWWGVILFLQRGIFQSPVCQCLGIRGAAYWGRSPSLSTFPVSFAVPGSLVLQNELPNSWLDKEGTIFWLLPLNWSLFLVSYLLCPLQYTGPLSTEPLRSLAWWGLLLSVTLAGICYAIFLALLSSPLISIFQKRDEISHLLWFSLILFILVLIPLLFLYSYLGEVLRKGKDKSMCSICHLSPEIVSCPH